MSISIKPSSMPLEKIAEIYNSNPAFLQKHLGECKVCTKWCANEAKEMLNSDFKRYEITDGKDIVGFLDYCSGAEAYLSLVIIHNDFKRKGIGQKTLQMFEEQIKNEGGQTIRIDVVTDYEDNPLKFWQKNGYTTQGEVELSWDDRKFSAIKMVKQIYG